MPPDPSLPAVAHLAAEYAPFARTGGLGEAVANLAAFQRRGGQRVLAFLPRYRSVAEAAPGMTPVGLPFEVTLGPAVERVRLWRLPGGDDAPEVYAIEHDPFFDRAGLYGEAGADYPDNARRFALFVRAALRALASLAGGPCIVHAHDWHAALAPLLLRRGLADVSLPGARTVLSVHNPGYQGHFPAAVVPDIGLPWSVYEWTTLEWYGQANFLKAGLVSADAVVTVSPQQAAELRTPGGGFGLHEVFAHLGPRLRGILNGIDQGVWDPAHDPMIARPYDAGRLEGKGACRTALQRQFGLAEERTRPILAFAGRLARQKGIDLMLAALGQAALEAQFVFLGTGEPAYMHALEAAARRQPGRVGAELRFSDASEHRLMAGADIFLMPSEYEPCGLTQMRAQRYGTLPVARRVGGLVDTVSDEATGFMFDAFTEPAFLAALGRAIARWHEPEQWQRMMRAAMARDFGWERAVEAYAEVYRAVAAA